jgi:ABC-type lipoprotein export system ATPase subunit
VSIVEVRDLFCLYPVPAGSVAALRGLSLTVAPGERLVVHGPNGSGKTTLLRVLSGDQPVSAGRVTVAGVDLVGAGPPVRDRLRRNQLGQIDQHSRRTLRPELSVLDNVGLQLRIGGARARTARKEAARLLDRLGLRFLADREPTTLSGGERQRIAVAAALAHGPALVLADEPTGELDAEAADQVYDLLGFAVRELGSTLVMVTHDPRAARVADRVVRIRDGRLSEQWSPDAPERESLVVDDRGWLRLPEAARLVTGSSARVFAADGAVRLVPSGPAAEPSAETGSGHRPFGAPDPDARVLGRLTGVTVRFGDRTVLEEVGLAVRAGRLTAVSGRSGSGKSTLLGALVGLVPVQDGRVELAGTDVLELDRQARAGLRRHRVGMAAQGGALVEAMDVDENLRLARALRGLPEDRTLVDRLLAELDLTALRERPVRLLSGGERQRVSVARTLVSSPALAVLDEPTSQLDETHAAQVGQALLAAGRRGLAVLVATHDPAVLALADEVLDLGTTGARHSTPVPVR